MLYTAIGTLSGLTIGCLVSRILFKRTDKWDDMAKAGILISFTTFIGAGIGFGYGSARLAAGSYP